MQAKEYRFKIGDKTFTAFYDRSIRLWTVFEIDDENCQVGDADYYHDKNELNAALGVTIKDPNFPA